MTKSSNKSQTLQTIMRLKMWWKNMKSSSRYSSTTHSLWTCRKSSRTLWRRRAGDRNCCLIRKRSINCWLTWKEWGRYSISKSASSSSTLHMKASLEYSMTGTSRSKPEWLRLWSSWTLQGFWELLVMTPSSRSKSRTSASKSQTLWSRLAAAILNWRTSCQCLPYRVLLVEEIAKAISWQDIEWITCSRICKSWSASMPTQPHRWKNLRAFSEGSIKIMELSICLNRRILVDRISTWWEGKMMKTIWL